MRTGRTRSHLSAVLWTVVLPSIVAAMLLSAGHDALGTTETFAPKLEVDIPNIEFQRVTEDGPIYDVPWISNYITAAYRYAAGIASLLVGVMFIIGGFTYLTAGGDASRVQKGKQRIIDALIGLLLVLGSYVMLMTINPDLVIVTSLQVKKVARVSFTAEEKTDYGDTEGSNAGHEPVLDPSASESGGSGGGTSSSSGGSSTTGSARAVCRTIESCRTMCHGTRPTSTPGVMDPSLALRIPTNIDGLRGGSQRVSQAVLDGLTRAAADAFARGYTIVVSSGYRPLDRQIALVCSRIDDPERAAGIGSAVAWPGESNHGTGTAVDLQLVRNSDGRVVVGSGGCAGQAAGTLATTANSQLFDEIMTAAGAKRYNNEIWHYEFGGSSSCRCQFPNCPSPPMACSGNC